MAVEQVEVVDIDGGVAGTLCHFPSLEKAGASEEAPRPEDEAAGVVVECILAEGLSVSSEYLKASQDEGPSRFEVT